VIYSQANLLAHLAASKDEHDRGLCGLRLEPDGSTVAGSASSFLAVSPADVGRAAVPPSVGELASVGDVGLVVRLDLVEDALRSMPKVKKPELLYAAFTRHRDVRRAEFTTYDMRKEKRVSDLPKNDRYPDWREAFRKVLPAGTEGTRVVVNRRELQDLLRAIEKACPDKGDYNPLYLEVSPEGKGIVLRAVNHMTGQRVLGVLRAFSRGSGWLEMSGWEKSIFGKAVKLVRRAVKRVRRKR